jgi:hypothetical protein
MSQLVVLLDAAYRVIDRLGKENVELKRFNESQSVHLADDAQAKLREIKERIDNAILNARQGSRHLRLLRDIQKTLSND